MSFEACAALVERADPERFAAAMATPLPARRVLVPIYAFLAEVSRAPYLTAEPLIAEMRLQWWRDVLDEIAEGRPVRRHEVATPLAEALSPAAARHLRPAIEARRWDIDRAPFADAAALHDYLADTCGTPMEAAAIALGRAPAHRDFGFAVGLARFLPARAALEATGRRALPPGFDVAPSIAEARAALATAPGGPECLEGWLAAPRLARLAQDLPPEIGPLRRSLRLARLAQVRRPNFAH